MQRRYLWSAVVFAAVPVLVFACGGRTDIDLLLDSSAGAGGQAGHGGAGHAGTAGTAGTTAGTGTSGEGGNGLLCSPGQQVSCACPGTDLQGVQVCSSSGQAFSACTGCPTITTGGGGQNAGGAQNTGGSSAGTSNTAGTSNVGGTSNTGGTGTAGTGTAGKAGEAPDGGGDFFDALPFPLPDSGPIGECVACLQDKCDSAINGCYNNADCTAGIQCALTTCAGGGGGGNPLGGGGGLDFGCLLGCFNGNVSAVLSAVQAFQCITQTCGSNCGGDVLGDGGFPLGGLGGGGIPLGGLGGGNMPGSSLMMQGVRVPGPSEVPGYPRMQQALTPAQR